MKINVKSISYGLFAIPFFVVFPLLNIFDWANYILLFEVLFFLLCFAMKMVAYDLKIMNNKNSNKTDIFFLFLIYLSCLSISFFFGKISISSIVRVLQIMGCFTVFFFGSNMKIDIGTISFVKLCIKIVLLILCGHWIITGMAFVNYAFIFNNANPFATLLFCWYICLTLIEVKTSDFLSCLVCFFLIFLTSARSALVAVIVYQIILFAYQYLKNKKKNMNILMLMKFLFLGELVVMTAFTLIYPNLYHTEMGFSFDALSRMYLGKNFFSGRELIWSYLEDLIIIHPYFGYGLGVVPSDFLLYSNLSSHNLFLQTALQSGVISVLILIFILSKILIALINNTDNIFSSAGIGLVFAIVIHECFEISFTQNMLSYGLIMWFILGLGCKIQKKHIVV